MLALVNLLPLAWQDKAKAIVAALGTVVAVVVVAIPNMPSWASAVVAALTTLGVYQTPNNTPEPPSVG